MKKALFTTFLGFTISCGAQNGSTQMNRSNGSSQNAATAQYVENDSETNNIDIPKGCRKPSNHNNPEIRKLMNLTYTESEAERLLELKDLTENAQTTEEREAYISEARELTKDSVANFEQDCVALGFFDIFIDLISLPFAILGGLFGGIFG